MGAVGLPLWLPGLDFQLSNPYSVGSLSKAIAGPMCAEGFLGRTKAAAFWAALQALW